MIQRATKTAQPEKQTGAKTQAAQKTSPRVEVRRHTASPLAGRSLLRLPGGTGIQPLLRIGSPNDKYEQEAGRVAEQVMRMPDPRTNPAIGPASVSLRTDSTPPRAATIAPGLESRVNSLKGAGRPLSSSERDFFEPRFGANFGDIRVHSSSEAAETAQALDARAFTARRDIVLGPSQRAASSQQTRELLAHELTHSIHQETRFPPYSPLHGEPSQTGRKISKARQTSSSNPNPTSVVIQRQSGEESQGVFGVMDRTLNYLIGLVDRVPVAQFDPLAPLFKAGAIGFLRRTAKEGTLSLVQLGKNAISAMLSPSYMWGFLKGFLKGFFVDGLAGIFLLIYEIGKLAVGFAQFQFRLLRRLSTIDTSDLRALAIQVANLAGWIVGNAGSLWSGFLAKLPSAGGLVDVVADALSCLFAKAKDLAHRAGQAIADSLIKFFSQAEGVLGEKLAPPPAGLPVKSVSISCLPLSPRALVAR